MLLISLAIILTSSLFTNSFATSSSSTEKVSIKAVDQSYVNCYCWNVASIKGTVHSPTNPMADRKITVYVDAICNYSLVQNERNYYPGVSIPCTWQRNVGWHALLSYDASGKLQPYVKTNNRGIYTTLIYDFQNSNSTAPYYGTTYHFYSVDDLTHMKSATTSYLAA
jgi:hypothetical protein